MTHSLSQTVHDECRLSLEFVSFHTIFRFTVNMLDDQVEFHQLGRVILIELREEVGGIEFDASAKVILGDDRFERLAPYWQRGTWCVGCERDIEPQECRSRTTDGGVACRDCDPVANETLCRRCGAICRPAVRKRHMARFGETGQPS